MDQKAIKELEILHEVSQNEHINQRHLSKKLGMAAGLVNIYLKRLVHKGYIKVTGIKPRRLKYLVTPTGIAEKTRLTYEFALISYKYFKNTTDDIKKKLSELEKAGKTNIVIFGLGELTELCVLVSKEMDFRIVAIVDGDAGSNQFLDYPVVPPEILRNLIFDAIIVARIDGHDEIATTLDNMGIDSDRVCFLLEV